MFDFDYTVNVGKRIPFSSEAQKARGIPNHKRIIEQCAKHYHENHDDLQDNSVITLYERGNGKPICKSSVTVERTINHAADNVVYNK